MQKVLAVIAAAGHAAAIKIHGDSNEQNSCAVSNNGSQTNSLPASQTPSSTNPETQSEKKLKKDSLRNAAAKAVSDEVFGEEGQLPQADKEAQLDHRRSGLFSSPLLSKDDEKQVLDEFDALVQEHEQNLQVQGKKDGAGQEPQNGLSDATSTSTTRTQKEPSQQPSEEDRRQIQQPNPAVDSSRISDVHTPLVEDSNDDMNSTMGEYGDSTEATLEEQDDVPPRSSPLFSNPLPAISARVGLMIDAARSLRRGPRRESQPQNVFSPALDDDIPATSNVQVFEKPLLTARVGRSESTSKYVTWELPSVDISQEELQAKFEK